MIRLSALVALAAAFVPAAALAASPFSDPVTTNAFHAAFDNNLFTFPPSNSFSASSPGVLAPTFSFITSEPAVIFSVTDPVFDPAGLPPIDTALTLGALSPASLEIRLLTMSSADFLGNSGTAALIGSWDANFDPGQDPDPFEQTASIGFFVPSVAPPDPDPVPPGLPRESSFGVTLSDSTQLAIDFLTVASGANMDDAAPFEITVQNLSTLAEQVAVVPDNASGSVPFALDPLADYRLTIRDLSRTEDFTGTHELFHFGRFDFQVTTVPEPASISIWLLLGITSLGAAWQCRGLQV